MKPMHFAMALLSAAMFFVLAGVFMGVQLGLDGTKLVVDTAPDIRWQWVFIGTAVVFLFQLLRPLFQKTLKNVSGPKFVLPAIDGTTVKQKLFLVALLVAAVAWPFMVSRGTVDIATLTMIYVILGLGLNVVVGLSGLLVLGYGGFYAIGAYTFALLNHYYGLGFWTCLPLAGLVSAAAGFLLGFPVLRLRGDYLAIVTLGFGEIVRILLLNNTEITGGPNGISQIPKPTFFGLEFSRSAREGGWDTFSNFFGVKYDPSDRVIFLYLVALLLVVLSLFVINRLLRMPLGRAWEALREDEIACRSLGLSPTRIKLTAFTISAAFAGFAGTLFAARQGFVSPESFTFAESAFVLAIVVLGDTASSDLWRENAAITATVVQLACVDEGLASCWVHVNGRPRRKDAPDGETAADYLRTFLPIPDGCEPLCAIAAGYSDFTPAPLPATDDEARIIRLK